MTERRNSKKYWDLEVEKLTYKSEIKQRER